MYFQGRMRIFAMGGGGGEVSFKKIGYHMTVLKLDDIEEIC